MDNAELDAIRREIEKMRALGVGSVMLNNATVEALVAEIERLRGLLHAAVDMLGADKAVELLKREGDGIVDIGGGT